MASSWATNSAVHRMRVKQSGSRVKPEVATVSLGQGVFGGDRHARIETEWEQSNPGEFPKMLTPCESVHRYHACTWTRTYKTTLSISRSTVSLRLFALQIQTNIACISFFSCCTTLERLNISFSIHEFYYLHWNLTLKKTKVEPHMQLNDETYDYLGKTFLKWRQSCSTTDMYERPSTIWNLTLEKGNYVLS